MDNIDSRKDFEELDIWPTLHAKRVRYENFILPSIHYTMSQEEKITS